MTDAFTDLPLAYERKLEWIDSEQKAAEERHVEIIKQLLSKSREVTSGCTARLILSADELLAINAYFEAKLNNIVAGQQDAVTQFNQYQEQLSNNVPLILRETILAGAVARNTQFEVVFLMSQLVTQFMDFLYLDLQVIFEEEDGAPVRAFVEEAKSGLLDSLLGIIPGMDIVLIAVHATQAALKARKNLRNSAADYILYIESYNNACLRWIAGMDSYIAGLQAFRALNS